MPSFSLVIEYLTGYAVSTSAANREQAEWPPHPARVFMALTAAHFETNGDGKDKLGEDEERAALEWLATLSPPELTVPPHTLREAQVVYVPVNDQKGGDALLRRSRQPRFFPRVYIGSELVKQTWHTSDDKTADHLTALERVCRNVTRIGHSSSLVWVRLERDSIEEPTLIPDQHSLENGMRVPRAGALQRLESAFNKSAIDNFVDLEEQMAAAKGQSRKQLQEKLKKEFPLGKPTSQRPVFSISRGYRRAVLSSASDSPSLFDPNFIVLRESDDANQAFGLESTMQVMEALRNLIMSQSKIQPVPSWVGGHEANGNKLTTQNHMLLVPLAFVGRPWINAERHADGHLMGVGIIIPNELSYRERAKVLAPILFDEKTNEPRTLDLKMGRIGLWKVVRQTDLSSKRTLQTETYSSPHCSWASVTPVLLDRMPKSDRVSEPLACREEVAAIITQSCRHVGLPEPIAVRVEKTPFFHGSLRAMPGQGGFPQLRKDKFQVHVAVEFERPVQGPIVLGAGRFRGYGLMRPWQSGEAR